MKKNVFNSLGVIILCVAAFILSESFCSATETNAVPKKFNAYIGGFLGTSYTVELVDGVLKYSEIEPSKKVTTTIVNPSSEEWLNFRRELDKIKIWSWKTNYSNSNIRDGTQWSIEVEYAERSLTAQGDNNYPKSSGKPNNKPQRTEVFKDYLAAVQKLLGGKQFK